MDDPHILVPGPGSRVKDAGVLHRKYSPMPAERARALNRRVPFHLCRSARRSSLQPLPLLGFRRFSCEQNRRVFPWHAVCEYPLVYKKVLNTVRSWTLNEWKDAYRNGLKPVDAMRSLMQELSPDDPAWILRLDAEAVIASAQALESKGSVASLPLYGVPFAIKDNIDVAGLATTAGCPGFSYIADHTAPVVQRLLDAGALLIGKTNLDQFATGLVGTRSPYGAVPNTFDADYISGGSSSGSASVVARGLVPFALGTDTAGSGRVPAGFNNLVGLKPTRGALSSRGVFPACRTLDCVSIFALTVEDAATVFALTAIHDAADPYARPAPVAAASARFPAHPRLGVPAAPQWFGDADAEQAYLKALKQVEAMGAELVPLDFSALHETAALLYDGPWVAERYAAIERFIGTQPEAMDAVVRDVVLRAREFTATDAFRAEYRLAELRRVAQQLIGSVDALLVPTAPSIYTRAQIEAEPLQLNTRLGTYTNFVNLLDWCALSLPAGFRDDGLPSGVTLIAPAWRDAALAELGTRWQRHAPWTLGATGRALPAAAPMTNTPSPDVVRLAVVGAHLRGMPLNVQLTERVSAFVEATTTSDAYRLYALPGTVPPKPGLARVGAGQGAAIQVELWDVPLHSFGSFVAAIPAPLGIGTLTLADGREVKGFICEAWALADARDITGFGGWRAYMAAQRAAAAATA